MVSFPLCLVRLERMESERLSFLESVEDVLSEDPTMMARISDTFLGCVFLSSVCSALSIFLALRYSNASATPLTPPFCHLTDQVAFWGRKTTRDSRG